MARFSSSRRRAVRGETMNLYPAETSLGWRIVRQVTAMEAAEKVALGHWSWVWYETGELAGAQMLASFKTDFDLPSNDRTAATITLVEVRMNAGEMGRSHTLGMPEYRRVSRHAKYDDKRILEPEDKIERAIFKIKMWPLLRNIEPGLRVQVREITDENEFTQLECEGA